MNIPSLLFLLVVLFADYWLILGFTTPAFLKGDLTGLYVVTALVFGLNVLTVVSLIHAIAAFRKGSMRIEFVDKIYEQGDALSGQVSVNLRKMLEARWIRVRLTATAYRPTDNGPSSYTVWQREIDLMGASILDPKEYKFPFSFEIPKQPAEESNGLIEKLMKQSVRGTISWQISAEMDLSGANLSATSAVRVNDGDLF